MGFRVWAGAGVGSVGGFSSGGGDVVGRATFPFAMMSFQLDVEPSDSFIAFSLAVRAAIIEISQYCWLSISLLMRSDVSISSRNLLLGGGC